MADPRLIRVLEACYEEIEAGGEPDVVLHCQHDAELIEEVDRILGRERRITDGLRPTQLNSRVGGDHPETLGDFRILSVIGTGGMGRVFRAEQISLGREVALKVLRPEVVHTEAAQQRFEREATITAALDHPGIVPVYATGVIDRQSYLAMRLVRGQSLDQHPLPLAPEKAAGIVAAVADALHAAHEVGVLHRDVKPANILLEDGRPIVVDFGLARFEQASHGLTHADAAPGTLAYIPPELLSRRAPVFDPKVDVYSLGATLYELLVGSPPFVHELQIRLMRMVLSQDPQPMNLGRRHRDLETIAMRALEKKPESRFASIAEMAEELRRYRNGEPILSVPISWIERCWRRVRRYPAISSAAAVAILALLTLGVVLWLQAEDLESRRTNGASSVRRQIAAGFLSDAKAELLSLHQQLGEFPELRPLASDLDAEEWVSRVVMILQSPTMVGNATSIAKLLAALRDSPSPAAVTPRASLIRLVATMVTTERGEWNSLTHRLTPQLRIDFPRTCSLLSILAAGSPDKTERAERWLAKNQIGSNPTDHLFAAWALWQLGVPLGKRDRELRSAPPTGRDIDGIQFARSIVLEHRHDFDAAYKELARLAKRSIHAPIAHTVRARLAAKLGWSKQALRHLQDAAEAARQHPYLRRFHLLTELQVYQDLDGDTTDRFWDLWNRAKPEVQDHPMFWMFASYAALTEHEFAATPEAGDTRLREARKYVERAIAASPGRPKMAIVSARIQIDWLLNPWRDENEPLEPGRPYDEEKTRLTRLAKEAMNLFQRGRISQRRLVCSEALLTASRCHRAIGNRRLGWQLLEKACRSYDEPEVLYEYAYRVMYRVVLVHLGIRDDDQSGGTLRTAAVLACERALEVIQRARRGSVDPDLVRESKCAWMICSYHAGDAVKALELASAEPPEDQLESTETLRQLILTWGIPLKQLLSSSTPVSVETLEMIRRAIIEMGQALDRKIIPPEHVHRVLTNWGRLPEFQRLCKDTDLGESLEATRQRLR